MKRLYSTVGIVLGCAVLLSLSIYYKLSEQDSSREAYTKWLHGLYVDAPFSEGDYRKRPKADRPDMAGFHEFIQSVDPSLGRVPHEKLRAAEATKRSASRTKTGEDFKWSNLPADKAGRIRAMAIEPGSANKTLWAGSVTGGLWKNDDVFDPASSWENISSFSENLSVGAILFDEDDPNTMYVGTGESFTALYIYRESSGVGQGIFKTTDGGKTWQQLPASATFRYINDLVMRKERGKSVLYAAVVSGQYQGTTFGGNDGVYRSEDGGASWSQVLPNMKDRAEPYAPSDIEIGANGQLFVGTMRKSDYKGGGRILTSTDGTNWQVYNDFADNNFDEASGHYPGRVLLAASPTDPDRVYGIISGGQYDPVTDYINDNQGYSYIVQTFDAGTSWSNVPQPELSFSEGGWGRWSNITWHAAAISVDPNDPNTIVVGALNSLMLRETDKVVAADQYSNKWEAISYWYQSANFPTMVHADMHKIIHVPNSSDTLLICTDGGIYYTTNLSVTSVGVFGEPGNVFPTFTRANKGLNTLQYYSVSSTPVEGTTYLLGGTQDNGTQIQKNFGTEGEFITGGDGAYCFIDQDEPALKITSLYWNGYFFLSTSEAGVTQLLSRSSSPSSGLFINPADYDSKNNTLYANAMRAFKQTASSPLVYPDSIFRISDIELVGSGVNYTEEFVAANTGVDVPFSAVKLSPHDDDVLFVGTQNGRLFKLTNIQRGKIVAEEIGSVNFPTANISSIAIGKTANDLAITFSNYGVESVWYTTNGGTKWEAIEDGLPDMPVRWIVYNPFTDYDMLVIATELGVWYLPSLKDDKTWQPTDGFPNVRVDMLAVKEADQSIYAASHGRGFFRGELPKTDVTTALPKELENLKVSIFPNPIASEFSINFPREMSEVSYQIVDVSGKVWKQEEFARPISNHRINRTGIPAGMYIMIITQGKDKIGRKLLFE